MKDTPRDWEKTKSKEENPKVVAVKRYAYLFPLQIVSQFKKIKNMPKKSWIFGLHGPARMQQILVTNFLKIFQFFYSHLQVWMQNQKG